MIAFAKYLFQPKGRYNEVSWPTIIKCRATGHPYPVVWYNVNGFEPDMTCTNCGDDLG